MQHVPCGEVDHTRGEVRLFSCKHYNYVQYILRTNSKFLLRSAAAAQVGSTIVSVSLSFGLTYGILVWCVAHVSGGHINPAVTFSFLVARKITFPQAASYVAAQVVGALVGAAVLYGTTPTYEAVPGFGVAQPATAAAYPLGPVGVGQVFVVEAVVSFALVLTVFATCDQNRMNFLGLGPLTIGWSASAGYFWSVSGVISG